MQRRHFLLGLSGAALVPWVGCGGDDDGPDGGSASFIIMNADDADHVHQLEIHCVDLIQAEPVSYTATGSHEHTISLSVGQLEAIAGGEMVEISFTDGHAHRFVILQPADVC